mgnify:FL=1
MENRKKAVRILAALDSSKAPISWHCIDEEDLILAIVRELNRIDKEEKAGAG